MRPLTDHGRQLVMPGHRRLRESEWNAPWVDWFPTIRTNFKDSSAACRLICNRYSMNPTPPPAHASGDERMKALLIVLAVLVLAAAGGGWYWQHNSGPKISFRTAEVKRGELLATISATGTIEPMDVIDVGAQVAGRIDKFGNDAEGKVVDYGSAVKKDIELAHIDESIPLSDLLNAEAQKAQADATLEHSKADLERLKALKDQAPSAVGTRKSQGAQRSGTPKTTTKRSKPTGRRQWRILKWAKQP